MSRPRKYLSPEDKLTANREKSKRSYNNHREKINARRRAQYSERKLRGGAHRERQAGNALSGLPGDNHWWVNLSFMRGSFMNLAPRDEIVQISVECLVTLAERTYVQYGEIIGNSPYMFLKSTCDHFVQRRHADSGEAKRKIDAQITELAKLASRLLRVHVDLTRLEYDVGDALRKVESLAQPVRRTLADLADISEAIEADEAQFCHDYMQGRLYYQNH
ncbi:hypothetical protein CC2G_014366 [Coprinopsis cinerea AmutBmut pab1-1]|nr:hypothetical protein CC2G_014366 [Coprinopsis cinerea AmutBmut pab1-1]